MDCGSIPENLIETELFGYAAGTFSGASKTGKIGLIEAAAGGTVTLTATERAILQKLLDNRGHIVTYDALCEAVWGSDYYGCENSLNVHIRHLREKVEEQPSQPVWILTARGLGYKLAKEGTK